MVARDLANARASIGDLGASAYRDVRKDGRITLAQEPGGRGAALEPTRAELIPTRGTWVGGRRDIRAGTTLSSLALEPGDVVMPHTDGCTETRNPSGEDFGIDRLVAVFERVASGPVANIPEELQRAVSSCWDPAEDDVTFVVFRHLGQAPGATRPQ